MKNNASFNDIAVTCPWCGTHYIQFQTNCDKCGGALPLPPRSEPVQAARLPSPPPPPRQIPSSYMGSILSADAYAITGGILALLGGIFALLGFVFTAAIVTAFVGLPFAGIGVLLLGISVPLLVWRYQNARQRCDLMRDGVAVLGEIVQVSESIHIRVNHRFPWQINYRFQYEGVWREGHITTLTTPRDFQQAGDPVYVIVRPDNPDHHTLYRANQL
ncbi:MAG TPA: hypothetical protein PKW33_11585 [Anaerolineaceae bacterium]|nr:hypothetical protein [Anaerolineaceae bacterium]HPN52222.1 hypothetical protein [Anaerolineaceae bacterium]